MQFITWLQNNSVGVSEAIRQLLIVGMVFGGLLWTPEQFGIVMSAVGAVLAVITSKTTVGANNVGKRIDEAHEAGIAVGTGNGALGTDPGMVPAGQSYKNRA